MLAPKRLSICSHFENYENERSFENPVTAAFFISSNFFLCVIQIKWTPLKECLQDWHAVIKPRWSWITHTGPMAGSQNCPPQGCLALQQNTLTSAISQRSGIPKTHQTRSTVYWHWVVSETEFKKACCSLEVLFLWGTYLSLKVDVTGIECSKLGFHQAEFEFN